MPVPTSISQLSTTASLNSPDGAVDVPSSIDDYQRAHAAFIAQLRDRTATDLPNTPAGNIAATTVQAALNELDSEKANVGALASSGITGAAASGANADITSMTAVTSISATGGTAVKGTNTNDSAAAGYVGEYISSTLASGSAISLTSATAANITSISLTAGDWDVSGYITFVTSASTSISVLTGGPNSTSATIPNFPDRAQYAAEANVPGALNIGIAIASTRFSLASTTTIYLVGQAIFTASTLTAYGRISARRVR
jgi:hypothetical protein